MHISQLYLSTYSPTKLIDGQVQVTHDDITVTIKLSEGQRLDIQNICVKAFEQHQHRIADAVTSNTPAYIALEAPRDEGDIAEFEPVDEQPF